MKQWLLPIEVLGNHVVMDLYVGTILINKFRILFFVLFIGNNGA